MSSTKENGGIVASAEADEHSDIGGAWGGGDFVTTLRSVPIIVETWK